MSSLLRIVVGAVLSLIMIGGSSPAAAFHEETEDFPAVWEGSFDGPAWIALRFTVAEPDPGGDTDYDLVFLTEGNVEEWLFAARHLLDEDGQPLGASFFGAGCGGGLAEVRLETEATGVVVNESIDDRECEGLGTGTAWDLPPGTYTLVHITGSDGEFTADLDVRAAENVTLHAITSGDGFDAADAEFGGAMNGHARTEALEAQAIVDGSVSEVADGRLFGWFTSDGTSVTRVDGPAGSERNLNFSHVFEGEPAGEYRFAVEAKADAFPIFWTRVWLVGAGVTLP